MRPTVRAPAAAVLVALVLGTPALVGCSGGDGGSGDGGDSGGAAGAPVDAAVADFCDAYDSLADSLAEDLDAAESEQEQTRAAVAALRGWAERLGSTGTPASTPEEARAGFEALVSATEDLPDDAEAADLERIEAGYSDRERAAVDAFTTWAGERCAPEGVDGGGIDLPE